MVHPVYKIYCDFFTCVPFLNQRADYGEGDLTVFMKDEQSYVLLLMRDPQDIVSLNGHLPRGRKVRILSSGILPYVWGFH